MPPLIEETDPENTDEDFKEQVLAHWHGHMQNPTLSAAPRKLSSPQHRKKAPKKTACKRKSKSDQVAQTLVFSAGEESSTSTGSSAIVYADSSSPPSPVSELGKNSEESQEELA